jgi:hypothetical protein
MWIADLYCDLVWLAAQNSVLPEPRVRLPAAVSRVRDIPCEMLFYGDDIALRHIRVVMQTDLHEDADACVDANVPHWVSAVETCVMLQSGLPFRACAMSPGLVMVAMFAGAADSPVAIHVGLPTRQHVDYEALAEAVGTWTAEKGQHLFYFRRLVDPDYPFDVRWLNGYRFFEWHFVTNPALHSRRADLNGSPEWLALLDRFRESFVPLLRDRQQPAGLMEEARALAAHAFRGGSPARRSSGARRDAEDLQRAARHGGRGLERATRALRVSGAIPHLSA